MPPDWLYMREEKREGEAEDSGINDDDHVTSVGNYERVAVVTTLKNVTLGYKKDDKIDFGDFEIELPMGSRDEDLWATTQDSKKHLRGISTITEIIGDYFTEEDRTRRQEAGTRRLSSVQFSCSVVSASLRPHEPQHTRLPCPSPTPGVSQTHVHWVGDAIQPSHSLSSPSPPAPNPSHHQSLFQWVSSSHEMARVLEFQLQHQSFQGTPRTDFL